MIQIISFRNVYANERLNNLIQKNISNISKYNLGLIRIDMVIRKNKHYPDSIDKFNCHLSVDDDSGFSVDVNEKGDSPGKAVALAFRRLRKAIKRYHRKLNSN